MTMTHSHDLWLVVPEIDEDTMLIETNDAGGPPVLWIERGDDSYPWIYNWKTGLYERPVSIDIV